MTYAVVDGGVVTNTIIADATFASQISGEHDAVVQIDELDPIPAIGWTYDGSTFSPPEPPPEG